MTVFPISWHRQNLVNIRAHLTARRAELSRLQDTIARIESDVVFAEQQLSEASRRGLSGFDPEKLLKPKRKKRDA